MISIRTKKAEHLRCGTTIEIEDSNKNTFSMEIGGNTDLYWIVKGRAEQFIFDINKDNDFYPILTDLFKKIKKDDNPNYPTLEGNTFSWISEDRPREDANNLKIEKLEDKFVLQFNKNSSNFYPMCVICFCNSGSYHPKIELHFMNLFNSLAHNKNNEEEPASE